MKKYVFEDEKRNAYAALDKLVEQLGKGETLRGKDIGDIHNITLMDWYTKNMYRMRNKYIVVQAKEVREMFSKSLKKRLRYRGDWEVFLFEGLEVVSYALSFYRYILKKVGRTTLPFDIRILASDKKLLTELGDLAFTHGETFSKDWRYLCHLKRLDDYRFDKDTEQLVGDTKYWITKKHHWYMGQEDAFMQIFEEETDKWVNTNIDQFTRMGDMTFEQFVLNRTLWANNGSGYMGKDSVRYPQEVKKYSHTKWLRAWTLGDSELMKYTTTAGPIWHSIQQKPEIGKFRAVAAADLKSYLWMKYIWDVWLKDALHKWDKTPILMSNSQKWNMWRKLTKMGLWNIPLDQAEFDQMQLKECVLMIIRYIKNKSPKVLHAIFDLIIYGLENGKIEVRIGINEKIILEYENGVMSGWFWTAFMDTVLNEITMQVALRQLRQIGFTVSLESLFLQGDDDDTRCKTYNDCALIYLSYKAMGFKVNVLKFYISQTRDEFLRRSCTQGKVFGYPARSIASLLWSSPERSTGEISDISSRVDLWKKLADRTESLIKNLPVDRDIMGMMHWSKSTTISYLTTSKVMGGMGIESGYMNVEQDYLYDLEQIPENEEQLTAHLTGFKDMESRFGELDKSLVSQTVKKKSAKVGGTFVLKKEKVTIKDIKLGFEKPFDDFGDVKRPRNFWRPQYKQALGQTLSEALGILPENYDEYRILFRGATSKLAKLILKGQLKVIVPQYAGYSTEYLSAIYATQEYNVMRFLSMRHRATYYDFLRCQAYINRKKLVGDYTSSE